MSAGQTAAYGVAFSPSGKVLVTTDTSGVIRLWDVTTHQRIGKPIAPKGRHEFLLEALSPNGKILATTQFDGPAQLWHLNLRTKLNDSSTPPPQRSRTGIFHRVPVIQALFRGGEWSRPDTLTAIGLAVALAAIVTPILLPILQPNQSGPGLQVEEVEIAQARKIDASFQAPGMAAPQSEHDSGPAIDITLRNNGAEPALIVKAVFSFVRATELDSCTGGAGAGVSTAEYDVKVPTAKSATAESRLILSRDMRFIIDANSIDRFRISLGPNEYSSVSWPWIYEFNLSLVEDNGHHLDLGPMSVLGFSVPSARPSLWEPLRGLTQIQVVINQLMPCVARDAAELSRAVAWPGLHSPNLQKLYKEFERLTTDAPSCRQIPIAQNPNGCPAPGGKGLFLSDRSGVTICSKVLEVLIGFTCSEAEDIMREYKEANAPRAVSMTFMVGTQQLPMRCLPKGQAEVCRGLDGQGLEVGFIP
jgi:hypothetical protein